MNERIEELRRIVSANPGSSEFAELALLLSDSPTSRPEAREVCFRGLAESPSNTAGRLLLARLFYLDGLAEFAVRELVELRRYAAPPSLEKLIRSFGPLGERYLDTVPASVPVTDAAADEETDSDVVAEIDIDGDFMDALEELEQEKK